MNAFLETALTLENNSVKKWRTGGGRVMGYTCSYVPEEIFHSAGIMPFRVRGFSASGTTIGDTYFGPFICSMPKCMLQLAGEGKFRFLDGLIITPGCDSMRRLDECWRKAAGDIADIMPGFFFHFGVPHKYTGYTVKWFTDEIRRIISALEDHFGVRVTDEGLSSSIKIYNRTRNLLAAFDNLRTLDAPPFTGTEALAVILAASAIPRDEYNLLLEKFITEAEGRGSITKRRRVMLVGSANDDIELVRLIEGSTAVVAADNLCFGSRSYSDMVSEEEDPVTALAQRYLSTSLCPRMFGGYKERLALLKEKITAARIEGVVLQNIRFCDLHGAENGLFEKEIEAMGVPCLRLEREYGPLVETGRMKMRIDAFIERIAAGRISA